MNSRMLRAVVCASTIVAAPAAARERDHLFPERGPFADSHPYHPELAKSLLRGSPVLLMVVVPSTGSEQAVYVLDEDPRPKDVHVLADGPGALDHKVVWAKIEGQLWTLRGFGGPGPPRGGPDYKPPVSFKEAPISRSTVEALEQAWNCVLRETKPQPPEMASIDGTGFHFANHEFSGWTFDWYERRPKLDALTDLGFRLIRYVMADESERATMAKAMKEAAERLQEMCASSR